MESLMPEKLQNVESYLRNTNTKRYVVENSITKVTSDGEPHGMMTMVAMLAGMLAAIIILSIVVTLVGCKKNKRRRTCRDCNVSMHADTSIEKQRGSLETESKRTSISTIYNSSIGGDLLSAPAAQPLHLCDSLQQKKKSQIHWQNELERKEQNTIVETSIGGGVKRY